MVRVGGFFGFRCNSGRRLDCVADGRPMTKRQDRDSIYAKRQFDTEIIVLCVRWYITYRLSYRDLVEMMTERGVIVSRTTIMRWVIRYVPEFEKRWNRFARSIGSSWRVDETYISIKGNSTICTEPWTSKGAA